MPSSTMSQNKPKSNWIEWAMINRQVIYSIVAVFVALGVYGLLNMPRQEFPDFVIRQGLVIGVFPGATSQEVEEQLTTKVENYLFGFKEVKKAKTYSHSTEGMMIIYVELADDVKNSDEFWSKLSHGLNTLKQSLPTGVAALMVNSDFGDTSALLITLSSDQKDYKDLEKILTKLEARIRKIPEVSKIKRYGLQKEKIFVTIDPAKLNEYNIKPMMLLGTLQTNGAAGYPGIYDNDVQRLPVHIPQRFATEAELGNQIVYADPNGNVMHLKDIATIERKYDKPDEFIRFDGKSTILLSLEMATGHNIVQFGEKVNKIMAQFNKENEGVVKTEVISDLPDVVDRSISHFMKEFLMAIISVILVTMLLLPFRVSAVAAITIPISILMGLGLLSLMGVALHTVSLAALIVVLGMVVDNSIVVIDNHLEKLDHGLSAWEAAWKSAKELFIPVLTATMAINIAFFPLMIFLTGTSGDFVGSFPITVAVTLTISMLVAVLLVPTLNYLFIKKGLTTKNQTTQKFNMLDWLQKAFNNLLDLAYKYKKTTLASGLAIVIGGILLFSKVPQQLFPTLERDQFAVEVYMPQGSSLSMTDKVLDSLEQFLLKDPRVKHVTAFIGNGSPRFHTVYAPHAPSKDYGQLIVNTVSNEATVELLNENSQKFNYTYPGTHVKFKQLELTQSTSPIEIRLSGDSIQSLKFAAEQVKSILRKEKNFNWIRDDWGEPVQGISVEGIEQQTSRLGLTRLILGGSLMPINEGLPLATIWEGDYPVAVELHQPLDKQITSLGDQYITSPLTFQAFPLRSVANLKPDMSEGKIVRRNGEKTITVSCDVKRGNIPSVLLDGAIDELNALKLPAGVTLTYGGDVEGALETFIPMTISLSVSILLIFFILLFQFKKVNKTLMIMIGIILALPGAALGLELMNYPFGLTAFIGVMGLVGIVVRNGIILVDYIDELVEKRGIPVAEAAIMAGKRRMRPIFLTSAAAAVGVIPMILSGSLLWGPLGSVICFGLLIAMVLTLIIFPVLYAMVFGKKKDAMLKTQLIDENE